ncbi:MAG TPA: hypothetical protein VGB77_15760 [Abditibacteriaceae bacterium]|jgi:hypothetical protein
MNQSTNIGTQASFDEYEAHCACCGAGHTQSFKAASEAEPEKNGVKRGPDGAMLTPNGPFYCANCARGVMVCRVCGCTNEAACNGGCSWAEPNLCSECHARQQTHPGTTWMSGPQWHNTNNGTCPNCRGKIDYDDRFWQHWGQDTWMHLCLPLSEVM